jgi:hypothetical protein
VFGPCPRRRSTRRRHCVRRYRHVEGRRANRTPRRAHSSPVRSMRPARRTRLLNKLGKGLAVADGDGSARHGPGRSRTVPTQYSTPGAELHATMGFPMPRPVQLLGPDVQIRAHEYQAVTDPDHLRRPGATAGASPHQRPAISGRRAADAEGLDAAGHRGCPGGAYVNQARLPQSSSGRRPGSSVVAADAGVHAPEVFNKSVDTTLAVCLS